MTAGRDPGRLLRVGIAGLGYGLDVQWPAFRTIPNVEIVAFLGRGRQRAAVAAQRSGLPALTDSAAWFDQGFDAASIAVPPAEMEPLVMAALERGLAVLCEKPLGPSAEAARRLTAQAAGHVTAVDFQFAELDTFSALKTCLSEGAIGPVRHVAVTWLTESWAQRSGAASWKTTADQAGGVLGLLGSHLLFLAEWLLGPADRLFARTSASSRGVAGAPSDRAEDLIHLMLDRSPGPVFSAICGNANPGCSIHRWIVVGDKGVATLENTGRDYMAGFTLAVAGPDGALKLRVCEPPAEGDGRIRPFGRIAARWVQAATRGEDCKPNFSDGLRVQELSEMARRSAAAGSWVACRVKD